MTKGFATPPGVVLRRVRRLRPPRRSSRATGATDFGLYFAKRPNVNAVRGLRRVGERTCCDGNCSKSPIDPECENRSVSNTPSSRTDAQGRVTHERQAAP